MRRPNLKEIGTGVALTVATMFPMTGAAVLINGVNYDASGRSEIVWTDDGSYGIQVFNGLDENGNIRILEYGKVNDSHFTRDSFTLNTDYTFDPLNKVLVDSGIAVDGSEARALYSDNLSSDGTLDTGNGWFLTSVGDGTDRVENNGVYIYGNPQWKVPVLGDYLVRESALSAANIADHSSAEVIDGKLFNDRGQFYGQVTFQNDNEWNLRSQGNTLNLDSTGVEGQGIGVIPEPTTYLLVGLGGAIAGIIRRIKTNYGYSNA